MYINENLLREVLKCIFKQTPDSFQIKTFLELSENISSGIKFLNRSGHLSAESFCAVCHCGGLRC